MNSIEEVKSYNINIYGSTYKGFTVDSEWEQLICYKNEMGKVIALNHKGIFDNIFPDLGIKPKEDELTILMASPCFQDKRGSNERANTKN